MPKKSSDPFMAGLWAALVADKLGPGGNETEWAETPVRIRNRFIRAVRQVLQSGAAFAASTIEIDPAAKAKTAPRPAANAASQPRKKTSGKRPDPRELRLPLMTSVQSREEPGKAKTAAKKPRR
jgi:hypothetical protein